MAELTLGLAQAHARAVADRLRMVEFVARRLDNPQLTEAVVALHQALGNVRSAAGVMLGVTDQQIVPDTRGKPPRPAAAIAA